MSADPQVACLAETKMFRLEQYRLSDIVSTKKQSFLVVSFCSSKTKMICGHKSKSCNTCLIAAAIG